MRCEHCDEMKAELETLLKAMEDCSLALFLDVRNSERIRALLQRIEASDA